MANPPDDFVDVPFTPDANAMADAAVAQLQAAWTDWTPNDADPEVVLIEAIAPMAASAETLAAQVPGEAVRAIGTKLYGIAYDNGSPAQTTVTLTFVDGRSYTVPAGGQINIDGYAFALNSDAVIAPSGGAGPFVLAGCPVTATVNAEAATGLTGALCASLNLPSFVTAISVDAPTSDGTDPMDDTTYTNLVVAKIRLKGDTLISATDFALEAVLQPGVGFAWAQGNTARVVTVVLADPNAQPVPSSVKAAVNTIFSDPSVRGVNITYNLLDPVYTAVSVTYAVKIPATQDATAAAAAIANLLNQVLSPVTATKSTDSTIHVYKLVALIGGLQAVDYVESITLSGSNIAELSAALTTGAGTTAVQVNALTNALPAGVYTITDPTGANTDTFTTTAAAAPTATTLTCTAKTFNYAYPVNSIIGGGVTGDLMLPGGIASLPMPGTFTGTIDIEAA
jgi:hypothetical protein